MILPLVKFRVLFPSHVLQMRNVEIISKNHTGIWQTQESDLGMPKFALYSSLPTGYLRDLAWGKKIRFFTPRFALNYFSSRSYLF